MNTFLIDAINSDNLPEAKRLLAAGADPNAQESESEKTALDIVVRAHRESDTEFISLLMTHGADPNFIRPGGEWSPFTWACTSPKEENILAMLDSNGPIKIDLLMVNDECENSAMLIAKKRLSFCVHLMSRMQRYFEESVLFDEKNKGKLSDGHLWLSVDKCGRNAFSQNSHIKNKQWILDQNFIEKSILIETSDKQNRTALFLAVYWGNKTNVNFLLGCGARIDVADADGVTLMKLAEDRALTRNCVDSENIFGTLRAVDASRKAMSAIDELMAPYQGARP